MSLALGAQLRPATREHSHFILDSFRRSLADLGAVPAGLIGAHVAGLETQLRGGVARVVVATPIGHPETFLGWAAESFGSLLFSYTGHWYRGEGIARKMVAELFTTGPIKLVYWTDTAEEIREHGFPLVHDWREFARRERAAELATMRRYQSHMERVIA